MTQIFECPQCHGEVKPDHLACYSCGTTADVRPTVVTGDHRRMIAEAEEHIEDALANIINHHLNHLRSDLTGAVEKELIHAKEKLNVLYSEFTREDED